VVVTTASGFRTAVREYRFDSFAFDGDTIEAARASVAEAGLIVVGEPRGMYETPAVVYSLAVALGTRVVAFEWSHEVMGARSRLRPDRLLRLRASLEARALRGVLLRGRPHHDRAFRTPATSQGGKPT
jgi:hypothetical protein